MDFDITTVFDAVAQAVPEREAIVWRDRRISFLELLRRKRRLANLLLAEGFAVHAERSDLDPWQSGQDHLALYLHNGNEYLEGMLGAYAARVAPFNVNYRYVEEELVYLLNDARARGIIYHSAFADRLAGIRERVPTLELLLQVADDSGIGDLLPGARWYEEALATSRDTDPAAGVCPDDLYILYTGGTTGMPKGVLWRQADIFPAALGGRDLSTGAEWEAIDPMLASARNSGARFMPAPPFMHGAAHWMALTAFTGGNTVVLPHTTTQLDPADVWRTVESERVNVLLVVGDAFAHPLLEELDRDEYDLSSMLILASGGAALSAPVKEALLEHNPSMGILDGLGASETGQQAAQVIGAGTSATTGTFTPGPGMCIVSEDLTRLLAPGETDLGWLGQRGRVPLGYLGDEGKTRRTFPVVDGERLAIPGDRAAYSSDGLLELHGRESATINSGGEKIFAEEVERALKNHPDVADVVVCGRPSERWGNEVVAVVRLREGSHPGEDGILAVAEKHIARFKLPKAFVFVDAVERSPAGKADYRWAREQAAGSAPGS